MSLIDVNNIDQRHEQIIAELARHLMKTEEPREIPSIVLAVVNGEFTRCREEIARLMTASGSST